MKVYDIVIVGKNISAMTAAIYAGMANIKTLQIACPEETVEVSGVNNYLGYKTGSYEGFHAKTKQQLEKFNVEKSEENIRKIVIEKGAARIYGNDEILARTLIVSTEEILKKIEKTSNTQDFVFKCGKILNNSTEMISQAGTGCMAAMEAREFISKIAKK
ncbi:hypothetical protein NEMIN01_1590 [Nematocida minor]|uniref:uncharacterized protein n=1 Tax=Nematocida minor TaxID=1912983 RepID=UPI00221FFA57|nr:uncharacterized protein NEMIN01_1590 [Nematocida minor]KAI5191606.1 hypothetical protein NEMIN01_1590 [Nematocida minor]